MKPLSSLAQSFLTRWRSWVRRTSVSLLSAATTGAAPIDLRLAGRVVLHAALVGLAAGLMGAAFFWSLEYAQRYVLEGLTGYIPLRAQGESFAEPAPHVEFRPWLLVILPALGGLATGLVVHFARETRGGGGDSTIEAFHHRGGVIRRRVIWIKWIASVFTLGTGGAGGREGPTMQIGGALGSFAARALGVNSRERRILLVAGVAAGISAVFRTPLGAALLAVEFLYRDGFESEALIPSVLASVVSYSIVIALFGESTLFGNVERFPFVVAHLPLYALLALLVSFFGVLFVKALQFSRRVFQRLPVPVWSRPALGGIALGMFATPVIVLVGTYIRAEGQGLGILGGGYGAVQMAISGSAFLPHGWLGVELLLLLAIAKLVAAALTIGSEGSAGDFAPSLAIGGLLGGAFGRAAELMNWDSRIHAGSFALVGMAAFYGAIAHVPLSALILACELAGNYDLLVPLMLALGVSLAIVRGVSLYDSQVATQTESPVHRDAFLLDVLQSVRVRDILSENRSFHQLRENTTATEMLRALEESDTQEVFPVLTQAGSLVGLVTTTSLRVIAKERDEVPWLLAADLMQPKVHVTLDCDLRTASSLLIGNSLHQLPIVDAEGRVVAMLDEADILKWHVVTGSDSSKTPLPKHRWNPPVPDDAAKPQ